MKRVSFIIAVLLLLAIPIGVYINGRQQDIRSQATPSTVLSLTPATLTKKPNDVFTLSVFIDTGSNTVSAAKLVVNADGTKIAITGITADTFLTNTIVAASITPTKGTITLGSPPASPKQGTGTLATVSFKVLDLAGTSSITLTGSQVAGIGEQNDVLTQSIPSTIIVESVVVPTPTPTQTAVVPTPTPTQVAVNASPTNVPTSTPTAVQYQNQDTDTEGNTLQGDPMPVTGTFEPKMLIPIISAVGIILAGIIL